MIRRLAVQLQKVDHRWVYYVNQQWKCRWMDWLMLRITHLGGAGITLTFLGLWMLFVPSPARYWAVEGLMSLIFSHAAVRLGKHYWHRLRPYLQLSELRTFPDSLQDYSFPSGHTTAAFSIVVVWILHEPWLSCILLPPALLVGLSRIYLGLHYPTDVAVGAWLGTVFSIGCHYLFF
ncbi:undecaprenyl-diphosphatase [Melghirimyces algeriensis]|uniref:Undecaprenyl-diphosphatase n=2 Tax=Melghirimyces algeriensis TaxID=910412 RepID=A0A521BPN6_9BACL|nr:undecaprenyl-diphosphatase [Melghirimyces algeriensis]